MIKVSTLKKNPKNPRQIKGEKLELLKASVGGFQKMMTLRPMIVDENNIVLGGNMRLAAIKALGLREIPDDWVKRVDDLTEDEKAEFVIKDNNSFGEYDWDAISNEWTDYPLADWGLDVPGFEAVEEVGEADAEPQIDKAAELNKKWGVVSGDLWQIGEHRLLCGDSTSPQDVEKLMSGERAEMLFTSPPYSDQRIYEGDDVAVEHLVKFIPAFYPFCSYMAVNLGLKRQDNEIVEYWQDYLIEARHSGYKLLSWNIWDRSQAGMGSIGNASAMFPIVHEWIFVFGEKRKDLTPTVPNEYAGDVRKKTNRQADGTMAVRYHETRAFSELRSVFASVMGNADQKEANHPAMFPTELPTEYIKAMTDSGQGVCEPFAGSGTTLVACQNLNRKCYAIEISENYCAVILERMATAFPDIEIKRIENAKGNSKN
jgi:DNA modification methylase